MIFQVITCKDPISEQVNVALTLWQRHRAASHAHEKELNYMMMTWRDPKYAPAFALLLSGGLLCGAWFFQYVLHYQPCQMCYWQRHAHKVVVILAVLLILVGLRKKPLPNYAPYLLALAMLGSFAMAFWHVGVEYSWWEGPKTCSGVADPDNVNIDILLGQLDQVIRPPACTDIAWSWLGVSMAGWNALISLGGTVVLFLMNKGSNQNA